MYFEQCQKAWENRRSNEQEGDKTGIAEEFEQLEQEDVVERYCTYDCYDA